jgi:AraC-like DNA-binding protein
MEKSPPMGKSHKKDQAVNWVYPLDKERALLAALRRGDKCTATKILDELFTLIQKNEHGNFDSIRFFAIELAVILSRAAGEVLKAEDAYYSCFARLQEARTVEDLSKNLLLMIDHVGPKIFSFLGIRHASALRKAERFIWENYTHKVGLKEIATASGLSAPYFSTIFKKEMGKNLSTYINQLRIDKAAVYLEETTLPLNEIAKACGFEDQSWFSKIFKAHIGLSPGKYREQGNKKTEGF